MTVQLGVVMDPIQRINPKKDSTLAMLLAARKRGWTVHYMEPGDLHLEQGHAMGYCRELEVMDDLSDWFRFSGERQAQPLSQLDVILMRQDPPFDSEFLYATQILHRAEAEGVLVVNKPQSVRDCNEKLFATEFPQCCPPVIVTRDAARLRAFHAEHKKVVFKPLDGMGGASIFVVDESGLNLGVVIEQLSDHGTRQVMAQRYLPEIKQGDKRILLIDGEPVPYALARIPMAGESRGNLAAGGSGEGRELTDRDRWICEQVGPRLKAMDLMFVGIDVIGDYLTEINVTSPTCIRELDRAFNLDIGGQLMDYIESRLR